MTAKTTVPVGERALIARINRKLKPEGEKLKKLRGERWLNDLGQYYVVNEHFNRVEQQHVDLEELARACGALEAWEHLADEEETETVTGRLV